MVEDAAHVAPLAAAKRAAHEPRGCDLLRSACPQAATLLDTAIALIDRIVHHADIIPIEGQSYRRRTEAHEAAGGERLIEYRSKFPRFPRSANIRAGYARVMRFEPRSAVFPGRGVADHRSLAVVDFFSDNLREGALRPDVYDPALTYFHLYVISDVFSRYVVG